MPIYDKEKKQKYDREWARRKRAGLPTRTTLIYTKEEQIKMRKESRYKSIHNRRIKRRERLRNKFGCDCPICHQTYRLQIHRKNGMPHKDLLQMRNEEFEEVVNGNEYVQVCYDCHKHIHWCMEYLKMTWEDINESLTMRL